MTPAAQAVLHCWSLPLGVNVAIILVAIVYIRGWFRLRSSSPATISAWHLASFLLGLLWLWLAIGSPLEAFDDLSILAHMIQHLSLMIAAPPLLLLGAPAMPLLHGLPERFVRGALGTFLRNGAVQRVGTSITDPLFCWITAMIALIAWHIPAAFELALGSGGWHDVEHICFFGTSVLFWWPVIQPWPSVSRWPRWSIPLYLLLGAIAGSAVSAYLCFSERLLYPSYADAPRIWGLAPLADQEIAGAVMWVAMTIAFCLPAFLITVRVLSPVRPRQVVAARVNR
jgi:cytochrome c oxidase assembly factor CtaG